VLVPVDGSGRLPASVVLLPTLPPPAPGPTTSGAATSGVIPSLRSARASEDSGPGPTSVRRFPPPALASARCTVAPVVAFVP